MAAQSVTLLLALARLHAAALSWQDPRLRALEGPNATYIPGTLVRMPPDYEDYARGRTPWVLFPADAVPGRRTPSESPGVGLPAYHPATSQEVFMDAKPTDPVGHRCAPGGDAAGHYFYNVQAPEVVPFVLTKDDIHNTGAAVVVAPGGGSIHLAWEPEGISAAEWFNTLGISAFVLKYRVPDRTGLLQLMDAQRAMSLVRSKAEEYGIDPSRIGFMGSSAGGALALRLQNSPERAYAAFDDADTVSYKPDFLILNYPGIDLMRDAAPQNLRRMPPTIFGFAENDPCCLSSTAHAFQASFEMFGTSPHLIMDFPEGGHGWGSCDYYPQLRGMQVCSWKAEAEAFLKKVRILE